MLTVAPLASGQAGYYLALTASAYYTEGPEPEGYWYGHGAKEFDLAGPVTPEHLTRLCEGVDPHTEKRLVRNALTEGRKHGDDLCFSAPKSVSVAWALATDELRAKIQDKMHRAVRDALDYIEDACGYARVGKQGQRIEKVPLAFALFEHSSSRAGDPQLHVHAVCPNLTRHADGRTTAIDSTHFYHAMMAGGALFRASLAQGLRELGFEVERDKSSFRLKGIDPQLCDEFSKRRAEIVEGLLKRAQSLDGLGHLEREELLRATSGRMAEIVALDSRAAKQERPRSVLFASWRQTAHELGIAEHHVVTLVNEPRKETPEQKQRTKEVIAAEAVQELANQYSHWSETDYLRRLAEAAQDKGLNAREIRELAQAKLADAELIHLGELVTDQKNASRKAWRERTEARYTTPEILQQERQMLGAVERMTHKSAPVGREIAEGVVELTRKKLAAEGKTLTDEQAHAIRYLTAENPGLVQCMTGKAGTGKSTTLNACRMAWEIDGRTVLGCALAGVAADALRESSNIISDTLAMTLKRLEHGRLTLTPKHVVVLDEAGMVATKAMAALIGYVEKAGAKLVLVGDAAQLQAIGAGGPFASIAERVGECRLTKIQRQREEWRKTAVEQLSQGEAREALKAYAEKKQLHVTKTRDEAMARLVEQWKADGGVENPRDVLLLASLNAEVKAMNRMCQAERQQAGALGERSLLLAGDRIHEREKVLLTRKDRRLGLENGFTAEVVAVDEMNNRITVKLDKDGREVRIAVKDYGAEHIKIGYAATVHKSQGRTIEHCHVLLGGPLTDLHIGYVSASRARESTHLVIDRAHAGPDLKDAIRSLSKDRTKDLAHDILDRQRQRLEQEQEPQLRRERQQGLSLGM